MGLPSDRYYLLTIEAKAKRRAKESSARQYFR